jgi:hypothetical protein
MKDILIPHYHKLTPTERLSLAIAALARGDEEESTRLRETCPKVQYVAQIDLAYASKYDRLQTMAFLHTSHVLMAVIHYVGAQGLNDRREINQSIARMKAHCEAWAMFCEKIGQDAETVNQTLAAGYANIHQTIIENSDIEADADMREWMLNGWLDNWE